jgi:hypothetical protein
LRSTAAAKFLDNGAKEEGRGEGEAYSGTIQVQLEGNALGAEVQQQTSWSRGDRGWVGAFGDMDNCFHHCENVWNHVGAFLELAAAQQQQAAPIGGWLPSLVCPWCRGVVLSVPQMGIVGLPNVGKSTLFNVLTKLSIPAENFPFCTIEPNQVCIEAI